MDHAHRRRRLAAAAGPVTVGAAGPAAGVERLAGAHAEASRCLRVLFALGREGQWASPRQLGVYGLLLGQAGRAELEGLVARTLGPVLAYDAARGTDLLGSSRRPAPAPEPGVAPPAQPDVERTRAG